MTTQLLHCVDILDICRYSLRTAACCPLPVTISSFPAIVSARVRAKHHTNITPRYSNITTLQRDRMCDPYLAAQSLPAALQNLTLSSNISPGRRWPVRPHILWRPPPLSRLLHQTSTLSEYHYINTEITEAASWSVYITAAASAGTKCPLHWLYFHWSADDNICKLSRVL